MQSLGGVNVVGKNWGKGAASKIYGSQLPLKSTPNNTSLVTQQRKIPRVL